MTKNKKNKSETESKQTEIITQPSGIAVFIERMVAFKWTPLLLIVFFFLNGLYIMVHNSGSCDELGAHIPSGYLYWSTGQFGGGIDNPPLGQLIIGLLVKVLGLHYPLFSEQYLFLFRLPVLVLGVVLAFFLFRFTLLMYDKKTAVLALFFYCFSPNILAHSSLATLDIPIACFIFLTLYFSLRLFSTLSIKDYFLCCLCFGCALTTKIQAMVLTPLLLVLLVVYFHHRVQEPTTKLKEKNKRLNFKKLVIGFLLMGFILWVLINLVYLNLPLSEGKSMLPDSFMASIKDKFAHSEAGHFSYLMGQYSDKGWWYYFPLIILFKTPLAVLVLVLIGLFMKPEKKTVFFIFMPIGAFLAVAMSSHVNIGIRHILIIYPFLFILAALGARFLLNFQIKKKNLLPILLLLLCVWHVSDTLTITPHQLSYFNVLAGGSKNGHKIMVDSNYDWGLNDYDLENYVKERAIAFKINPDPFVPQAGHILVNVNALYGVLNEGPEAYLWLKEYQPLKQIAYTWFEYEVPEADLAKLAGFSKPEKHHYNYPDYLEADVNVLQQQYAADPNSETHLKLALMFIDRRDYSNALKEIRLVLKQDPTNSYALFLGGELIVRFKLGVLMFKDDGYLTFFKENRGKS